MDPVPTLNWVFENESKVSEILTQPGSRKNLLVDVKGPQQGYSGSYLVIL